jgi:hypothetical protein
MLKRLHKAEPRQIEKRNVESEERKNTSLCMQIRSARTHNPILEKKTKTYEKRV